MPRELPPPDQLLKPRDENPLIMVPPQTWHCLFCEPMGPEGSKTTVVWIGPLVDGPHGRCRDCGQKYVLGNHSGIKLREGLPAENLDNRTYFCSYYPTKIDPEKGFNVRWKENKGHCEECGQNYTSKAKIFAVINAEILR